HMNWPAPGDPWNVANTPDNDARRNYYGVNSIPYARVNGHYEVDPTNEAMMMAAAQFDQTFAYPVTITVTEDRSNLPDVKVHVEVNSDMALESYNLLVGAIVEHIEIPDLPQTLQYSNKQTEFEDAMLKMIPDGNGTAINM